MPWIRSPATAEAVLVTSALLSAGSGAVARSNQEGRGAGGGHRRHCTRRPRPCLKRCGDGSAINCFRRGHTKEPVRGRSRVNGAAPRGKRATRAHALAPDDPWNGAVAGIIASVSSAAPVCERRRRGWAAGVHRMSGRWRGAGQCRPSLSGCLSAHRNSHQKHRDGAPGENPGARAAPEPSAQPGPAMRRHDEQIPAALRERKRDLMDQVAAPHLEHGDLIAGHGMLDRVPEPRLYVLPLELQFCPSRVRREDRRGPPLGREAPGSGHHRDQVEAVPAGVAEDSRNDQRGKAVAERVESDDDVPAGERRGSATPSRYVRASSAPLRCAFQDASSPRPGDPERSQRRGRNRPPGRSG